MQHAVVLLLWRKVACNQSLSPCACVLLEFFLPKPIRRLYSVGDIWYTDTVYLGYSGWVTTELTEVSGTDIELIPNHIPEPLGTG